MKATKFKFFPEQKYKHTEYCNQEGEGDIYCRACREINNEPIGFSIGRFLCGVIIIIILCHAVNWIMDPANNHDDGDYTTEYP